MSKYEYEDMTLCTVAGWGDTSENGQLLDDLQKVEVPYKFVLEGRDFGPSEVRATCY